MLRTHPGATILHNLICSQGRARGDPRARRRAGAHQGRSLVHQADDGRDRRRVRRRALGALLLRPQLPRRQRTDRLDARARRAQPRRPAVCRSCASRSSATPRAARSTPRSTTPAAVIERVARGFAGQPTRTASTGSPSTAARGGSTCARRTPSRCCGSTSKPPTRDECDAPRRRGAGTDHQRLNRPIDRSTHGSRPAPARDPRLPRGQGPAVLPRATRRCCTTRACSARYDDPRRHPGDADRRGRRRVDDAEHERLMARSSSDGSIAPDVRRRR